jgi:dienelactone hydrolase
MIHFNPNIPHFKASYDYGAQTEKVSKPNALVAAINSLAVRIFKTLIYLGASILKPLYVDAKRIEKARDQLIIMGGQSVTMTTPDGDNIDGMHLKTKDFKAYIEKFCDIIETDNGDGTLKQTLQIKPEFCKEYLSISNGETSTLRTPNAEAQSFVKNLEGLGLRTTRFGVISKEKNIIGSIIELGEVPKDIPPLNAEIQSQPTVLIATGSTMSYAAYKGLAAAYLIRGINVMMVDYRGFGKSEGSPTDFRTKFDLDTAYQYLQVQHGIKNEDLVVHGYCLGGGAASDLAARRPGVNLILDRSFADYREVAGDQFPLIRGLIRKIMPSIVDYNNAKNLQNIKGNIAIVMSTDDELISKEQTMKLVDNLPELTPGKHFKPMATEMGHHDSWTDEASMSTQFNQFLDQANLRRRLF